MNRTMTTLTKMILTAVLFTGVLTMNARLASASTFDVLVNTAPLIGNPSGPFWLDFQLIGTASNSASITNFQFGGGSAVVSPTSPTHIGLASGNLTSGIQLNDDPANFFNEFYQLFNPGTFLRFTVSITTNLSATPDPDAFSFAILDSTLSNIQTTNFGNALFLFNITKSNPSLADLQGFTGVGAFSAVSAQAVPEPATLTLLATGLACVALRRRRNRRVERP